MASGCASAKSMAQIPVPVPASRTRWMVGGRGELLRGVVLEPECSRLFFFSVFLYSQIDIDRIDS